MISSDYRRTDPMSVLLSKFKGAMLGALVGDCIGAKYEVAWAPVSFDELKKMDQHLQKAEPPKDGSWLLYYTDDTEMAHVLAQSLVSDKGFVSKNVAKRFSTAYFSSRSERWYGGSVPTVFQKLRAAHYKGDPYKPASEQFDGKGSYGNGSGMRVMPVALFCHSDMEMLKDMAASSAKLTHSHVDAVNGAILQAAAVEFALASDETATWQDIWKQLKVLCDELEASLDASSDLPGEGKIYTKKLTKMHDFLSSGAEFTLNDIAEKIGVGIQACEAIPAAIFAFLCCLASQQPPGLESFGKLERTVMYAISLGGDTDTIGTMAGAIAGAFYGAASVPDCWVRACEGRKEAVEYATSLHKVVRKRLGRTSQS